MVAKIGDNPGSLLWGMVRGSKAFEDSQARIPYLTLQFTKKETLGKSFILTFLSAK